MENITNVGTNVEENDFLVGKRIDLTCNMKSNINFQIKEIGTFKEKGVDVVGMVRVPYIYTLTSYGTSKMVLTLVRDAKSIVGMCEFTNLSTPISKKTKVAIVDKIISNPNYRNEEMFYYCKLTHYNILYRSPSFWGTLIDIDGSNVETMSELINSFVDKDKQNFFHNDSIDSNGANYLELKPYKKFGGICWDMTNGKVILSTRTWGKNNDDMNNLNNVCFVKKSSIKILKTTNLYKSNIRMMTSRYYRVSKKYNAYIIDRKSGIEYTQSDFLKGIKVEKLTLTNVKTLITNLTNELSKDTQNVYCCAKKNYITKSNGFRQMYSNYQTDTMGLIINFVTNKIDSGLKSKTYVSEGLHNDRLDIENNVISLSSKTIDAIAPLKKLGFDKINVFEYENREYLDIDKHNNTLNVYMALDNTLVKYYKNFPTSRKTDWAKVPMGDLWC